MAEKKVKFKKVTPNFKDILQKQKKIEKPNAQIRT